MLKRILISLIFVNIFVFAAGGIDKVNTLLENISTALYGIGVVSLTIAFIIAGYKIMFLHQTFREVLPVLIGGIIVGSASALAGYILG